MKELNAARRMELRRIEAGLCTRCGKNSPIVGLRCEQCRKDNNQKSLFHRENRKKSGLCDRCGKNKPQKGLFRCSDCLELESRKKINRYQLRKKAGLCVICKKTAVVGNVHCTDCSKKQNHNHKKNYYGLKDGVFAAYGGYICNCCQENEKDFLTIDHVNGDGNRHRKQLGSSPGNFYRWLKKNNYPDGFQVLCMNCNWGRRRDGICPHKRSQIVYCATE